MKIQSENIMVPEKISNFPTTKTSKIVNKKANIPNPIKNEFEIFSIKISFLSWIRYPIVKKGNPINKKFR